MYVFFFYVCHFVCGIYCVFGEYIYLSGKLEAGSKNIEILFRTINSQISINMAPTLQQKW